MAEISYLWDNPGTGDSPGGGYGNASLNQVIFRMLVNGTGNRGVFDGWLNELEVTDGGGLNAVVDTGAAMCYGVWYENDVAVNVAIGNNTTEWVVVRASWAAQTARLAAIAPGAFTQTAGVTYDIPLAQVTTVAGVITLIVDTREYCEFSTDIWPFGVTESHIQTDAVTVAKMIDQERWIDRGSGTIQPDIANPCTWTNQNFSYPYRDAWSFVDAAQSGGWVTFRVPADFTGANLEIHIRTNRRFAVTGDVRWCYSAWVAAPSAVLANQAACTVVTYTGTAGNPSIWLVGNIDALIGTIAVAAGDLVHVHVYRDGGHGTDNLAETAFLHLIRAEYTADS